jgi:hypothetical protein
MSADNYYVVRKHPAGGFTYVDAAVRDFSEYGVTVHPEISPLGRQVGIA